MTPNELTEFGNLIASDYAAADLWLDRYLATNPFAHTSDDNVSFYVPRRPEADVAIDTASELRQIAGLLVAAGLGPVALAARAASSCVSTFPSDDDFKAAQHEHDDRYPASAPSGPAEQVAAGLRLLFADGSFHGIDDLRARNPWLKAMVTQRLTELVAAYPALLHPRFCWDTARTCVSYATFLPLLHTFVDQWRPVDMVSPAVPQDHLRALAVHPVLDVAVHSGFDKAIGRGQTHAYGMSDLITQAWSAGYGHMPNIPLAASLLLFNRLRSQVGHKPLFKSDDPWLMNVGLIDSYVQTWCAADEDSSGMLVDELRQLPEMATPEFRQKLLQTSLRVLADPDPSNGTPDPSTPTYNWRPRLHRLVDSFVTLGLAQSRADAANVIVSNIFTGNTDHRVLTAADAPLIVDHGTALDFLREIEVIGGSVDLAIALITKGPAVYPGFQAAVETINTSRSMSTVIREAANEAGHVAAAPRPRFGV